MNGITCDMCIYYDIDLDYCKKAGAYKFGNGARADFCPLNTPWCEKLDVNTITNEEQIYDNNQDNDILF